jgi:hypothetical protein
MRRPFRSNTGCTTRGDKGTQWVREEEEKERLVRGRIFECASQYMTYSLHGVSCGPLSPSLPSWTYSIFMYSMFMVHVFHLFPGMYMNTKVPRTCLLPQPLLALSTSMFSFASSPGGGSSLKHHTESQPPCNELAGSTKEGLGRPVPKHQAWIHASPLPPYPTHASPPISSAWMNETCIYGGCKDFPSY